jgi:hypothetical protein
MGWIVDMKHLQNLLLSCIAEAGVMAYTVREGGDLKTLFNKQSNIVQLIVNVADGLKINVLEAVRGKMLLNDKKYPAKLCNGDIQKYTKYSGETRIDKCMGQTIVYWADNKIELTAERNDVRGLYSECELLTKATIEFSRQRGFEKYESLQNLVIALTGEIAELNDIFLWKDSHSSEVIITDDEWERAAQEIADVLIYYLKIRERSNNIM